MGGFEINPGAVKGTELRILEYPHPTLRSESCDVVDFDYSLKKLTREMFAVIAPQVGVSRRLMVYNPTGDSRQRKAEVVLCNPVIVEYSDEKDVEEEGCLSFPGFTADVERSIWIKVEFQDMKDFPNRSGDESKFTWMTSLQLMVQEARYDT
ncbi:MAG: hypothetical protein SGPRY_013839, partial [Prymnesium sp.]